MTSTNKCKIICDFDFSINQKMLNFVYKPIIGSKAVDLYCSLVHYHDFYQQLAIKNIELSIIMNDNNFNDANEFLTNLHLLESIGLVQSFQDQYKNDVITFKLIPCLFWEQFKSNYELMNLLSIKLEDIEFEKLKMSFEPYTTCGLINTSKTLNDIFNNQEQKQNNLNFELFHQFIYDKTKHFITIEQACKDLLNEAYVKYQLNYHELFQLVKDAIINQAKTWIIDQKLLLMNLKKTIDQKQLVNFDFNLKINRNKHIFIDKADLASFKYVIDDYKLLNAEHYLACIQKHELDDGQLSMIKILRKQYQLSDPFINILIDFCIFINNGRIEPLYIQKIALTIHRSNITEIQSLLKYLRKTVKIKMHEHEQGINNYMNKVQEKVNW